ncbi:MarR family winged helix-turn-helix transcriptional regulator [Spirochaeta isovalerica]|uniref:HTH-type transcriptional regulator SarZ n=1 Tax=Spirochaeta isovalerica TaxID=150 RepID=A0A841R4T7_9SPIO|nr:MarR family transcriptional regulator [Spirochaeta isovalerica]MBB6480154.1 DNA-binding MarR family transcriptional regulator [Spirochaeta isovalerica]
MKQKELGDLIIFLAKELKWETEKLFKEMNMGQGQLMMLLFLMGERELPIRQDLIAKKIGLNKANVSRNISKLKSKNLVSAEQDPEDSRKLLIHMTEKSEKLRDDFAIGFRKMQDQLTFDIPEKDLATTCKVLEKIHMNLDLYRRGEER